MKVNNIYFFLALMIFFSSCEKETELSIPRPEQKLVVNSILEANRPVKIYVGLSNYALDTGSAYVRDATVTLKNGRHSMDTLDYHSNGIYRDDAISVKEDSTYTIQVKAPGFKKVEAVSKVPSTVHFSDYTFEKDAGIGRDGSKNKRMTVRFNDDADKENYYMLMLEWHFLDSTEFGHYPGNNDWYSYSPVIKAEGSEDEDVFSDDLFNGESVSIPMNFSTFDLELYYDIQIGLKVFIITLNESYYQYHKSLYQQEQSQDNIWLSNSPPKVYTNIDGAFGVFTSVNVSDSIIINFKK